MEILEVRSDSWALERLVEEPELRDALADRGFEHLGYLFHRMRDMADASSPFIREMATGLTFEQLHLPGSGVWATVERVEEAQVVSLLTWLDDGALVCTSWWSSEPNVLASLTRMSMPGAGYYKERAELWHPDAMLSQHLARVKQLEAERGTTRVREIELADVVAQMSRAKEVSEQGMRALIPTGLFLFLALGVFVVFSALVGQTLAGLLPYLQVVWYAAVGAASLVVTLGPGSRRAVLGVISRFVRLPVQPRSHYLQQPEVAGALGDHMVHEPAA